MKIPENIVELAKEHISPESDDRAWTSMELADAVIDWLFEIDKLQAPNEE